ncbi:MULTISPECIES: hypothetical protein [unclassified Moorena]|nr:MULTISPECIES: hypothetical protein [unclassified Moorena]
MECCCFGSVADLSIQQSAVSDQRSAVSRQRSAVSLGLWPRYANG